jgi:hypothetical protein
MRAKANTKAEQKAKTKAKLDFIQRVLADAALSSTAKCVLVGLLLKFHNSRTGQCNPSPGTIAAAIGLSRRAVITAVAELKQSGWVDVTSTRGGSQRNTNRWHFDVSRTVPVSAAAPQTSEEDCTGAENFTGGVKQTSEGVKNTAHEPLKNPSPLRGEGEGDAALRRAPDGAPQEGSEEAWAEFWQLWQRGHGDNRERVRKAFAVAVAEHGEDAILASARRWASEKEPRYLPEPVKWLAGVWQSEPAPAPKRSGRNGGSYRSNKVNPVTEALRAGGINVDERDA